MYEKLILEIGVTAACPVLTKEGFKLFYEHENIIYSRESNDKGKTFSAPKFIFESPTKACVTAMRISEDKILLIRKMASTEEIIKLKLEGANHNCILLDEKTGEMTDYGQIENKNGCFYIMNDRLLRLSNGRIVLPEALHPRKDYAKELETSGICLCSYSDNEGKTWQHSNIISANDPQGHLAEPMIIESDNENELFMFIRNSTGYMHKSISHDNGENWNSETKTSIRMPCAPFCVKRDPFSNYIFIIWDNCSPAYPAYQYPRSPICLGVSRDNTETWDFICELDNDFSKSYGYPSIHFEKDCLITTYYQSPTRYFYPDKQQLKIKLVNRNELKIRQISYSELF